MQSLHMFPHKQVRAKNRKKVAQTPVNYLKLWVQLGKDQIEVLIEGFFRKQRQTAVLTVQSLRLPEDPW